MKPVIVANWKMNPSTLSEAKRLFNLVQRGVKNIKNVKVVICPPFPFILNLKSKIHAPYRNKVSGARLNLKLGAQDCFWLEKGAFTGQVSPAMLKDIGCQYVIIGHSERRQYCGETDDIISKKLKAAIKAKLTPILCLGETKDERGRGKTMAILRKQLATGLKNVLSSEFQYLPHPPSPLLEGGGISPPPSPLPLGEGGRGVGDIPFLVIAYEPVWAIGTGRACQPAVAKEVYLFLRKELKKLFSQRVGEKIPILYGGSVNDQNAASYLQEANMQGLLVGGASLHSKEFLQLIRKIRGPTSDKSLEI